VAEDCGQQRPREGASILRSRVLWSDRSQISGRITGHSYKTGTEYEQGRLSAAGRTGGL